MNGFISSAIGLLTALTNLCDIVSFDLELTFFPLQKVTWEPTS
jgi:hypothetical protein